MLFTKECDYAIRIMRALSSGELISVSRICEMEHLPSAMTYKGGYALNLKLAEISLYDLCAAIDPDILLLECMKEGYPCSMNSPKNPCLVHHEFCRLQNMLVQEMKQKSLAELFR